MDRYTGHYCLTCSLTAEFQLIERQTDRQTDRPNNKRTTDWQTDSQTRWTDILAKCVIGSIVEMIA